MAAGSRIRNQKDVAAGLIYIAFGAAFSIGALNYQLGEPARMGPGWFPFWVGILLAVTGVFTALAGLRRNAAVEKVPRPDVRTMAIVLGSVVAFGLLLIPMGLVVALVVLILGSSFASHAFTWKGALALTVLLTLFCVGVFIHGINLQMPLWPSFLR